HTRPQNSIMSHYVSRRRKYQEMIVTGNCLNRGLRKGTASKPRGKIISHCHPERSEEFAFAKCQGKSRFLTPFKMRTGSERQLRSLNSKLNPDCSTEPARSPTTRRLLVWAVP